MKADIVHLREDLVLLLQNQTDAWETAMVVGLTNEEMHKYEQREVRIRNLLVELSDWSDAPQV